MTDVNFSTIQQAICEAEQALLAADNRTYQLAMILKGRLRQVNSSRRYDGAELLKTLKKELGNFNARTGKWNS